MNGPYVVYFDQLLGAARTRKLVEILKMNKKAWKRLKKVFQTAFRCTQHPKAGWNTQHPYKVRSQPKLLLFYKKLIYKIGTIFWRHTLPKLTLQAQYRRGVFSQQIWSWEGVRSKFGLRLIAKLQISPANSLLTPYLTPNFCTKNSHSLVLLLKKWLDINVMVG